MTATYTLAGIVVQKSSGAAVPGLRMELWGEAAGLEVFLALSLSDSSGRFTFFVWDEDIPAIFGDATPEVFVRAIDKDVLMADTRETQRWSLGTEPSTIRIAVDEPIGPVEEPALLTVRGRLMDATNGALAGIEMKVSDVSLSDAQLLVEPAPTTDEGGYYSVQYDASAIIEGKVVPDIQVEAFDSSSAETLATSEVRCRAGATIVVDLVVGGTSYRESDYQGLSVQILPVLGSADLATLDENQLEQVACATNRSLDEVRALSNAQALVQEMNVGTTSVDREVVYGLLRQGLPSDRIGLLRRSRADLRAALLRASEARTIGITEAEIDAHLDTLRGAAADLAQEPAVQGTCNLDDVLAIAISGASDRRVFLERYCESDDVESFWSEITGATANLTAPVIDHAKLCIRWAVLARYHFPLIQWLDANKATYPDLEALAALDEDGWLGVLEPLSPSAPADMPGETDGEKRTNFAGILVRTIESAFPTRFIAKRIKDESPGSDLDKFFDQNQEFDFTKHRVSYFLSETPDLTNIADPDELKAELQRRERLFKLVPRHSEMKELLGQGLTSARAIARYGKVRFVETFAPTFGEKGAKVVYDTARRRAQGAMALFSMFNLEMRGPEMQVLPMGGSESIPNSPTIDYRALFGGMGLCRVPPGRSNLDPGAKVVDDLRWLGEQTDGSGGSLKDRLLERRPDIARIVLDANNTFTPVVTLDLVNELLERRLIGAVPTDNISTFGTAAELRAAPELVNEEHEQHHETAYSTLLTAVYPWRAPFSLWHEQARSFLVHLGITRAELMEILQRDGQPPTPTPEQIAQERLGMNSSAFQLITDVGPPAPWSLWGFSGEDVPTGSGPVPWHEHLQNVARFVEASGFSYEELRELLDTGFAATQLNSGTEESLLGREAGYFGCDIERLVLFPGLDPVQDETALEANWEHIQRLGRLVRWLGWSIRDVDRVLAAFGGAIDIPALLQLGDLQALRHRFDKLPLAELASWWAPLDIQGNLFLGEPSYYAQQFLSTALGHPTTLAPFAVAQLGAGEPLLGHVAHIRAVLRLSQADLALLIQPSEAASRLRLLPALQGTALDLPNLSRLFRLASLARAMSLSIADLRVLQALTGMAPLLGDDSANQATPAETRRFLDQPARLASTGLSVAEAHYLVRHVPRSAEGVSAEDQDLEQRHAALEASLDTLVEETRYIEERGGGASLRALLEKVIRSEQPERSAQDVASDVDAVLAIADGSSALGLDQQINELKRILRPCIADPELQAIVDSLTFRPYELASCQLWIEPSGVTGVDGEPIDAWTNLGSGASINISTTHEPRVVPAGPFGLRATAFSGTEYLDITVAYTSTSHSFFCIARHGGDASGGTVLDVQTGPLLLAATAPSPNPPAVGFQSGAGSWQTGSADGVGDHILGWVLDGTAQQADVYRDGVMVGENLTYDSPTEVGGAVGLGGRSANGNFGGMIACAGLFDDALGDEDVARIHDYLLVMAGRAPTERFAQIERALLDFVRLRDARLLIVENLASAVDIPFDTASALLNDTLRSPIVPSVALVEDLLPGTHAAPAPPRSMTERRLAVTRFSKAADVVRSLEMSTDEVRWLQGKAQIQGWLDFNDLPLTQWELAFDASKAPITADGVYELPSWLSLTCATENRSAQTSATTVRTGFAADSPRAFSRDGSSWGLLVEPGAENLITNQDLTTWSTYTQTPSLVTAPDGSSAALQHEDSHTGAAQIALRDFQCEIATYAMSVWTQRLVSGGSVSLWWFNAAAGLLKIEVGPNPDDSWTYRSVVSATAATTAQTSFRPVIDPPDTGKARSWGWQVEKRAYPTSFIGADNQTFTRDPDVVAVDISKLSPSGDHFDLRLVYAPLYADDEADGDHDLFFLDADHRVYFDAGVTKIVVRLGGSTVVESAALGFARHQRLSVHVRYDAWRVSLSVSGAQDGNGSLTAEAQVTMSWPSTAYLLGTAGGAQEGAVLCSFRLIVDVQGDLTDARPLFERLLRLGDILSLRERFRRKGSSLVELCTADTDREGFLDALAEAASWSREDVAYLAGPLGFDFTYPDQLRSDIGLVPIARAMDALRRLGVSAERAFAWTDVDTPVQQKTIAAEILAAAKSKHGNAWLEIAPKLRDVLREKQRDALVAAVLHKDGLESVDALYDELLIDPQMSACAVTSRVQNALLSIQHFVHRILLGLEPYKLDKDAREQWRWRKSYRVWEAGRKVFMWPENWIEPELRLDKTPFYSEQISQLQQGDLDERAAEAAYRDYLQKLDEVAHLRVVGMVHHKQKATETASSVDELHVFAQSFGGSPRPLFHRKWVRRRFWTPWERVPFEAPSQIFVPTIEHGRLSLYCLRSTKLDDKDHLYQLDVSHHDGRSWAKTQTSDMAQHIFPGDQLSLVAEHDDERPESRRMLVVGPVFDHSHVVAEAKVDPCHGDVSGFLIGGGSFILSKQRPVGALLKQGDFISYGSALVMPHWHGEIQLLGTVNGGAVQTERTRWLKSGVETFRPLDSFILRLHPGEPAAPGRRVLFGYFDPSFGVTPLKRHGAKHAARERHWVQEDPPLFVAATLDFFSMYAYLI